MCTILITGHEGLVGRYLWQRLEAVGYSLKGIDKQAVQSQFLGDITNSSDLADAVKGCDGIVHLAAVSRVVWGQNNPALCWQTNAQASKDLFKIALAMPQPPWVLAASSREIYGEPESLPVRETSVLNPVNIYGRAKHEMEQAALAAREAGLNTAVVRLANVYGCIHDHADRVLPAFCRAASTGEPLRVDGMNHTFDFTHISDTVEGLVRVIELLMSGVTDLPPLHLLPGIGTTLGEAAEMAVAAAESPSIIYEAESRNYDVARFVGDPTLAKEVLGWQAKVTPSQGISQLVKSFQEYYRA